MSWSLLSVSSGWLKKLGWTSSWEKQSTLGDYNISYTSYCGTKFSFENIDLCPLLCVCVAPHAFTCFIWYACSCFWLSLLSSLSPGSFSAISPFGFSDIALASCQFLWLI